VSVRDRGSILFGVLLVVVLATLVASTAMFRVRNNSDIVRASIRGDSSRTLLRSGIRAYLAELAEARPELLGGGLSFGGNGPAAAINPVRISDGLVVSEVGRRRGVVRLLAHPSGALVVPESTRIDLNRAERDMLLALPGMTETIADAIIARRSSRPFESVEELLGIDGVTLELLYGDLELWAERYRPADEALAERASVEAIGTEPVLADLVTVFSADPNVRSRLSSGDSSFDPLPRLLFPDEVFERDQDEVRILEQAADLVTPDQASRLVGASDETSLVRRLIVGVEPRRWATILDAITLSPDPYLLGRIDLTNAAPEVLACLPGLGEEAITELVRRRSELSDAVLARVTWPVEEGILTAEEFVGIAPWVTNRSLQFRLIIEAGYEMPTDEARSGDFAELELDQRIVAEVVIDISGDQPRIAYLRDVTWLADAFEIHTTSMEDRAADPEEWYDFEDPFAPMEFEGEPEDDGLEGFVRPSERADQQRREMRNRRPTNEDETQPEQQMPAGSQAEGRDRRIGRWNGAPRSGGN
jgi:hypothetical protein